MFTLLINYLYFTLYNEQITIFLKQICTKTIQNFQKADLVTVCRFFILSILSFPRLLNVNETYNNSAGHFMSKKTKANYNLSVQQEKLSSLSVAHVNKSHLHNIIVPLKW